MPIKSGSYISVTIKRTRSDLLRKCPRASAVRTFGLDEAEILKRVVGGRQS